MLQAQLGVGFLLMPMMCSSAARGASASFAIGGVMHHFCRKECSDRFRRRLDAETRRKSLACPSLGKEVLLRIC
jgi:hypothetical protein